MRTYVCANTAECEGKSVLQSEVQNFVCQNTRRHITNIKHLNTPKYMYCLKLLNCLHESAVDTWIDCNVVSTA